MEAAIDGVPGPSFMATTIVSRDWRVHDTFSAVLFGLEELPSTDVL